MVLVEDLANQTIAAKTILQQLTASDRQTDLVSVAPEPVLKTRHFETVWNGLRRFPMRPLHPASLPEATAAP